MKRRLHIELDEVLGGQLPTVERLVDLPYTQMVIKEALRLYPPVFCLGRKARSDHERGGHTLPTGSMILLCPYTTHRHPACWEQSEVFDPQRFTPEREASRPHYRLQLVPGHPVEPELSLTLRPRHGLPMTVSRLPL